MSRHLLLALSFLSPLVVLFLLALVVLRTTGELTPFETLVGYMERREPTIVGKEYIPDRSLVKEAVVSNKAFLVTVLGNSRAYQMRQEFFVSPTSFFNYAQAGNMNDLGAYLALTERNGIDAPAVVIMMLDPYFMLDGPSYHPPTEGIGTINWLVVFQHITKDILISKLPLSVLIDEEVGTTYIGARAAALRSGFRNDGSYTYGNKLVDWRQPEHEDYQFSYSKQMHVRGLNNFRHASAPNPEMLATFEDALRVAEERGVHVVILLPAFAPSIHALIAERPDQYRYIDIGSKELSHMAAAYGHAFFDLTNPAVLKLDDVDFYDGIHWDERANAKALLYMAASDKVLRQYVALESIGAKLKASPIGHYLFGVTY